MAEPISLTSLAVVAIVNGAGQEVGRQTAAYVCEGVSKATEKGWQNHAEANEALRNGLSQQKTAQA